MESKKRLIAIFASALGALTVSVAHAQEAPVSAAPEASITASARHYLDEMAIMDAQISYMQKEMELRNMLSRRTQQTSLPQVVSIVRDGSGASALVAFEGGVVRWVRTGEEVGDGIKVKRINRSHVVVSNQHNDFTLKFVSARSGQTEGGGSNHEVQLEAPKLHIPTLEVDEALEEE